VGILARVRELWRRQRLRGAFAAVLLACAAVLAWPAAVPSAPATWLDLIAPFEPGELIGGDYRLSPPRRGEERDVVFVARRLDGVSNTYHSVSKLVSNRYQSSASAAVSKRVPMTPRDARRTVRAGALRLVSQPGL
jgi:hypothetical protein